MKSKEWVEAAVVFYEHWFFVSDGVREKLVEKAREFEIFWKSCGSLDKEGARTYKNMIVAKVKAQCQNSEDFLNMVFGDLFSQVLYPISSQVLEPVETEMAVEELLKQGFNPTQVIESVTRGEGCDSEKVAKILANLNKSEESHSCSGHCEHCSGHGEHKAETPDLLKQVIAASKEEQEDILIALLKRKGLPLATMTVVIGKGEEQIQASKGFAI